MEETCYFCWVGGWVGWSRWVSQAGWVGWVARRLEQGPSASAIRLQQSAKLLEMGLMCALAWLVGWVGGWCGVYVPVRVKNCKRRDVNFTHTNPVDNSAASQRHRHVFGTDS